MFFNRIQYKFPEWLVVFLPEVDRELMVLWKFSFVFYRGDGDGGRGDQWAEVISWEPRAVVYHNFLVRPI